jgi:peptidoglycan/xylan/chitin deacetylase (PgdA/CDA1 family)
LKASGNKVKFLVGQTPIVETKSDRKLFIPKSYKAVVTISADFELAWAWQWSKQENSLELALDKSKTARLNIPRILELCDTHNIPVTWATVGHLFLDSCSGHEEMLQLSDFENNFWRFKNSDWFINDPETNFKDAPYWYAPDLINLILESKANHEIGCHTFAHIDCTERVCNSNVFNQDIDECKKEAQKRGLTLKSFVHPAHTIGNLDNLVKHGFTNFRTDYRNVLGFPKQHKNGLWELEQTAEFTYRKEWSVEYHIYRYIEIIKRAVKTNTVAVFWFHPSFPSVMVERILPAVLKFLDDNREEIWITTHGDYIDWLNNNEK